MNVKAQKCIISLSPALFLLRSRNRFESTLSQNDLFSLLSHTRVKTSKEQKDPHPFEHFEVFFTNFFLEQIKKEHASGENSWASISTSNLKFLAWNKSIQKVLLRAEFEFSFPEVTKDFSSFFLSLVQGQKIYLLLVCNFSFFYFCCVEKNDLKFQSKKLIVFCLLWAVDTRPTTCYVFPTFRWRQHILAILHKT